MTKQNDHMDHTNIRQWAWVILVIFIITSGVLGWQARKFSIDASADTLLMEDNQHYLETQKAGERYSPSEFILIAFVPASGRIYSTDALNTVQAISKKIRAIERVEDVRSLVNVPIFAGMDSFSADIKTETLSWKYQHYSEADLSGYMKHHPLYKGLLVNYDDTALAMQVIFSTPDEIEQIDKQVVALLSKKIDSKLDDKEKKTLAHLKKSKQAIEVKLNKKRSEEILKIRAIIDTYLTKGKFYMGGANLLAYELKDIIRSDLVIFGTVIIVIAGFVLLFLFRKPRWVLLPLLCCAVSVILTLGILGATGLRVTVISTNVIALQIILTLAIIIHLIVQYQENIEKDTHASHEAIVLKTIKEKFKPCLYSALTTGVGFASLIYSGIQPVISFGWMMVMAMMLTTIVGIFFFPALLLVLPSQTHVAHHRYIESLMKGVAQMVLTHPVFILLAALTVIITGSVGLLRLDSENSFIDYFSKSTDVYQELSFIDKHFGGSTPLDIIYSIPSEQQKQGLVITAKAVETVGRIRILLEKHKAVGNITSVEDFTRIASIVRGKPLTEYELSAFYRILDPAVKDQLFGSWFSPSHNEIRISTRIKDTTEGLNRQSLVRNIKEDLKSLGIKENEYKLTNLFILYQDILSRLIHSQIMTTGVVYIAMAVILIAIFGSIRIAIISLIPNVITTVTILGVMGIFGIPLDLMTMTIAAVAMGISMDDTIHYVHRFRTETGQGSEAAVKKTHLSVGYALIYTTAIIIIGFMSLVFSAFVPSILFGILVSIAMFIALVSDIIVLPVLLKRNAA